MSLVASLTLLSWTDMDMAVNYSFSFVLFTLGSNVFVVFVYSISKYLSVLATTTCYNLNLDSF